MKAKRYKSPPAGAGSWDLDSAIRLAIRMAWNAGDLEL